MLPHYPAAHPLRLFLSCVSLTAAYIQVAALVHIVTTIAKMVPLIVFCVAILLAFNMETFTLDIWGQGNTELGSVMDQVKSTMKVTLWVFIGIEGAVVVSARARHRKDVGRATVLALARGEDAASADAGALSLAGVAGCAGSGARTGQCARPRVRHWATGAPGRCIRGGARSAVAAVRGCV